MHLNCRGRSSAPDHARGFYSDPDTHDVCGWERKNEYEISEFTGRVTIRYEKSFVSAPLQINIHYESAAQLAVKRVPERNIYRRNKGSRNWWGCARYNKKLLQKSGPPAKKSQLRPCCSLKSKELRGRRSEAL